jgi:hypothetical protein
MVAHDLCAAAAAVVYVLLSMCCVTPLHLQEQGGSVTSATSLRMLVAASAMPTATVLPNVSMLPVQQD